MRFTRLKKKNFSLLKDARDVEKDKDRREMVAA